MSKNSLLPCAQQQCAEANKAINLVVQLVHEVVGIHHYDNIEQPFAEVPPDTLQEASKLLTNKLESLTALLCMVLSKVRFESPQQTPQTQSVTYEEAAPPPPADMPPPDDEVPVEIRLRRLERRVRNLTEMLEAVSK